VGAEGPWLLRVATASLVVAGTEAELVIAAGAVPFAATGLASPGVETTTLPDSLATGTDAEAGRKTRLGTSAILSYVI
jgi:hypothetical protein